jgi:hypothetical protein
MLQQTLLPVILLALSSAVSAIALPKSSNIKARTTLTLTLPSSGLPAPTGTLKYIALGLGTQNYTCAGTPGSTTAAPVSIGALAKLSDASQFLQEHQDLIPTLPGLALGLSTMTGIDPAKMMNLLYLGQHFFTSTLSPEFDLTAISCRLVAKKLADVAAPANACPGPNNAGAVDWLELSDNGAGLSFGGISSVYRVETAGGKAPATCSGQTGVITVPYAAEYWYYG